MNPKKDSLNINFKKNLCNCHFGKKTGFDKEKLAKLNYSTKKPIVRKKASGRVGIIIEYWNNKTDGSLHLRRSRKGTKTYNNCIGTIKQVLWGRHMGINQSPLFKDNPPTVDQIKETIDRFAQKAFNPACRPFDPEIKKRLRCLSIGLFFWNPQVSNFPSNFLALAENPQMGKPKPIAPCLKPLNKRIYTSFINIYHKEVLGDVEWKPPSVLINKFILAVNRFVKFLQRNKRALGTYIRMVSYEQMGTDFFTATVKSLPREYWKNPGIYGSDKNFDVRVPAWFREQGFISSDQTPSWRA